MKSSAGVTFYGAQSSASAIERRKGLREEQSQREVQDYREGTEHRFRTVPSETPTTPVPQVPLKSEQQVKILAARQAEPVNIDVSQGAAESKPAEARFDSGKIQPSTLASASNRNQGPASDYKTVKPTLAPAAVRFKQATRPQLLKPAT